MLEKVGYGLVWTVETYLTALVWYVCDSRNVGSMRRPNPEEAFVCPPGLPVPIRIILLAFPRPAVTKKRYTEPERFGFDM